MTGRDAPAVVVGEKAAVAEPCSALVGLTPQAGIERFPWEAEARRATRTPYPVVLRAMGISVLGKSSPLNKRAALCALAQA